MDGNGRWASGRNLPRSEGHRQGLKTAKRIVAEASRLGIDFLSLYVFSTENWKRTRDEVGFLMGLIRGHLVTELDFYRQNHIRVLHSGDRNGLASDILAEIDSVVADTAAFDGLTVNLAINYGGRNEILRAVKTAISEKGAAREEMNETSFASRFDHPEIPDPDLIIRTGGEMRLSNFLLWQSAYSELYFSNRLWPDFSEEDFRSAISDYASRERRFGGVK
jgi:undecaprenyl diphosphate synthase